MYKRRVIIEEQEMTMEILEEGEFFMHYKEKRNANENDEK
jgi:hypothetical protein